MGAGERQLKEALGLWQQSQLLEPDPEQLCRSSGQNPGPAHEEAAFRQVAASTAHGGGSSGPCPGAAYPLSTSFLVRFFAQLVSQKWKIHVALWKMIGRDRWSLWPELIFAWERNKDAPSLHFLNHVERSWKEKHLNERRINQWKLVSVRNNTRALVLFFFFSFFL